MKTKPTKPTRADLERQIMELRSQLVYQYHFADIGLSSATMTKCMGGGVILQLTATGGKKLVEPVCIRDGLSDETIAGLRKDLARSYLQSMELKPRLAKPEDAPDEKRDS